MRRRGAMVNPDEEKLVLKESVWRLMVEQPQALL